MEEGDNIMPQDQFGIGPSFNSDRYLGPPAISRDEYDTNARKSQTLNDSEWMKILSAMYGGGEDAMFGALGAPQNKSISSKIGFGVGMLPLVAGGISGARSLMSGAKNIPSMGMQSSRPFQGQFGTGVSPSMMPAEFAPMGGESIYNTARAGHLGEQAKKFQNVMPQNNVFGGGTMPPMRGGVNPAEELSRVKDYRIAAAKAKGEVKTR